MEQITTIVLAIVLLSALLTVRRILSKKISLKYIPGPPASWLYGNTVKFFYQDNVGDMDFNYLKRYGSAWLMHLPFGDESLVLADPKAIQHVMAKGGYNYGKPVQNKVINELMMGKGVVWADGDAHSRQRKILTPAFTPSQLRTFTTLFRASAAKLTQKWKEDVLQNAEEGQVIILNKWLARTTLDIVGEAAFDFDFGAMDNRDNKVSNAYHNMFADSVLHPPKWDILFKGLWRHLPTPLLSGVKYIPTREYQRFRSTLDIIEGVSRQLVQDKREAYLSGDAKSKDIMSLLVQANASQDPNAKLSDVEMIAQMATLTLAGHETTANTLTWTLWELAKHPEYQEKLRVEIAEYRAKLVERGATDFNMDDLEAMPHLNAVMKETLRFHPAIYHLGRVSKMDDVIPLAIPIHSVSGETVSSIPIAKGQHILISICAYNRLPEVWGEDAEVWNPMRWFDANLEKATKVGVYSNLMTFSAGLRSCIGWRFSVIESLALLVELIENFRFSLPGEKAEIIRLPTGIMTPMVRGREKEGVQMPLHITPV